MVSESVESFTLRCTGGNWMAAYSAMAGPCEIHIYGVEASEAHRLASLALAETRRIERKFSRYRDDNIIHAINSSSGAPVAIDDETYRLLHYAGQCYELSDSLFDITSGILRQAWTFNAQEAQPDQDLIDSLLALVGWSKVRLTESNVTLLPGMEIDLGGLGKEYAVDRVAELLREETDTPLMVNFGGDLRAVTGRASNAPPWIIGLENPRIHDTPIGRIELGHGAVATSGDSRRYCIVNGQRLGHILNPTTGWPVDRAPRSVTVLADRCIEAGLLATLGILRGHSAEEFLDAQAVKYHCIR